MLVTLADDWGMRADADTNPSLEERSRETETSPQQIAGWL